MENLKSPVKKVLLNKLDYTEVGAYYDSIAAVNMLSFKKYGVNIPYIAGNFNGAKIVTNNGSAQAIAMQLSSQCPCKACNWDYEVTIVKKVQLPGVDNNETNYNRKSYTGVVNKITCTGNNIDDVWLLQAEDDIITQITQDTGVMNSNPDPITGGGAWVNAIREYKITAAYNAAAYNVTITRSDTNVATTITLGATNVLSAAAINAQVAVTGVICLAVNTLSGAFGTETEFLLQSNTPGFLFTVADGGGASTITIDYRRIVFQGKTARTQFAVQYQFGNMQSNPVNPQVLYNKSQWVIDASNVGAVANSGISFFATLINTLTTTQYDATGNVATAALFVVSINDTSTLGQNHGYATLIGTNIIVNGDDNLANLTMAVSPDPANYVTSGYINACNYIASVCTFDQWGNVVTGTLPMTPKGQWPVNLGSEVFQKLAMNTDPGSVPFQDAYRPDPTIDYVCYWFKSSSIKPVASGGASDLLAKEYIVEVYIPKSLIATAFLRPTVAGTLQAQVGSTLNTAPVGAASTNIEELFQLWAGTGTIVVATGVVTGGLNPNAWTN